MIDIKQIEQNFEKVLDNLKKRDNSFDESILQDVVTLYKEKKMWIKQKEKNQFELNNISKDNKILFRNKDENQTKIDANKKRVEYIKKEIEDFSNEEKIVSKKLEDKLLNIPNLISEDVPVGKCEEDNVEISKWGDIPVFDFEVKEHSDLGENLGMLDFSKATELTGPRFVVYKGMLAKLERALINYFLDKLEEKGFEEHIVPYMVNRNTMIGTGQLPKFEEDLFKLEGKDWYMIPTAEVPLTNLKKKEIIKETIPLKYCAVTPCFRSEAGSYGKDTKGLIRLHQFQKVEMVVLCDGESSNKIHEEMVSISEDILKELKLPYRKLLLCSADMGFGANKCYDLEVWVPSQNKYREISSISNCGDFQARRAKIRHKKDNKNKYVHTLNGSALAVGRTVVAIMENYQQEDGSIVIPEVLVPYLRGKKIIKKDSDGNS